MGADPGHQQPHHPRPHHQRPRSPGGTPRPRPSFSAVSMLARQHPHRPGGVPSRASGWAPGRHHVAVLVGGGKKTVAAGEGTRPFAGQGPPSTTPTLSLGRTSWPREIPLLERGPEWPRTGRGGTPPPGKISDSVPPTDPPNRGSAPAPGRRLPGARTPSASNAQPQVPGFQNCRVVFVSVMRLLDDVPPPMAPLRWRPLHEAGSDAGGGFPRPCWLMSFVTLRLLELPPVYHRVGRGPVTAVQGQSLILRAFPEAPSAVPGGVGGLGPPSR